MAVTGLHGGSRFSIYFLRGNQSKTAEGTF
jgi:hypothetical protein